MICPIVESLNEKLLNQGRKYETVCEHATRRQSYSINCTMGGEDAYEVRSRMKNIRRKDDVQMWSECRKALGLPMLC